MTPDQIKGLLESTTEREFAILVVTAALSGVFTFVLGWKILSTFRDITARLIDWKDSSEETEEGP